MTNTEGQLIAINILQIGFPMPKPPRKVLLLQEFVSSERQIVGTCEFRGQQYRGTTCCN